MTTKRRPALATRTGSRRSFVVSGRGMDTVEEMARNGVETATIAAALGMSVSAFRQVMQRQPEVEQAYARGRAALSDELVSILLKQARKGITVAAIFLAKARCGWRELGDAPETRPNVTIVLPDATTPEQYLKLVGSSAPAKASPPPLLDFLKMDRKP